MQETTKRQLLQALTKGMGELSNAPNPDYRLISTFNNLIHQLVRDSRNGNE